MDRMEGILAESEHIGRVLFGSASRFRLGIWIASLPGMPRTFSAIEYWTFCRDAGWPGAGKPIEYEMRRSFEFCGMVLRRNDLRPKAKGRKVLWTKLPSTGWQLFEALDPWLRVGEPKLKLSELAERIAVTDLQRLREELQ